MAFDWEKASTHSGSGKRSDQLPAGVHDVEIKRVLFGSKKGAFASRSGDPQIMPIFADREGREAAQMITLSDKAGWVLARLLSAAGADMQRMKADGIVLRDFADPEFARANLVGRRLRIDLKYKRGADGKDYADVTPIKTRPAAAPAKPQTPPPADDLDSDDIPF